MFYESIQFHQDTPLAYEGWQIGSYHLHAHKDVIEILMVVKGKATLTVSCETFDMGEGDYVVIRESDSHQFSAAGNECELVSLYIDMKRYVSDFPHLYYVLFGCESFDLAKYRNESAKIRKMIVSILGNLIPGLESGAEQARREADSLMWILVNDYDMIKYYNRKWDAPFSRVEKYYRIMRHVFEQYDRRNILDYIADEEHYSKTTITHLVKDVGGTSLKDMLDYVRLFHAEKLLILTSMSVLEISDRCGFSDVKYFTSNFKKWYSFTPSEYRKRAVADNNRKSIFINLAPGEIFKKIQRLGCMETDDGNYKASVNPISTKVFGFAPGSQESKDGAEALSYRHLTGRQEEQGLASRMASLTADGKYKLLLMLDLRDTSVETWKEQAIGGVESCPEWGTGEMPCLLAYDQPNQEEEIRALIEELKKEYPDGRFESCLIQ